MTYKQIIEKLKESSDPNVLAFVKEMEHIKRLSPEERQYYMENRKDPKSARMVLRDFIPYIVKVAFEYSQETKVLSLLDLISEGVLGTCAALEKYDYKCTNLVRQIRAYVIKAIRKAIVINEDRMTEAKENMDCFSAIGERECSQEENIVNDIDRKREKLLLENWIMGHPNCHYKQIIIKIYLDDELSTDQIAKIFGITKQRVYQISNIPRQLHKYNSNLWKLFSKDFNLPVNETKFKCKK